MLIKQNKQNQPKQQQNLNFQERKSQTKVYLRVNLTKKGFDFYCDKSISSTNLIKKCRQVARLHYLIQQEFLLDAFTSMSKYILLHAGQKLYDSQQIINLEQSSIFYIVNKQQVEMPLINLKIKFINKKGQAISTNHFTQIKSGTVINLTLNEIVPLYFNKFMEQVDFFHLGKILNTTNYFCQEYIQNESQIICIDKLLHPIQKEQKKQINLLPVINPKKKVIAKQQSIQILGITEQPYKPTISFNQVYKNLKESTNSNQLILEEKIINNFEGENQKKKNIMKIQEELSNFNNNQVYNNQGAQAQKQQIRTKQQIEAMQVQQENI